MIRSIRNNIRKNRGFTLVELMIVVAIVGILAALAIYGVSKYMKSAKTAEARNSLGQLTKDASAAFNREKMASAVLAGGAATAVSNTLCGTAAAKVPALAAKIKGSKYQSLATEWEAGDASTGWQCLKFSMSEPQYFQYGYTATPSPSTGATGNKFAATAEGDLDADGVLSKFQMDGIIRDQTVVVSPAIAETTPEE
jgi:type IV pilus assembly protein PilA